MASLYPKSAPPGGDAPPGGPFRHNHGPSHPQQRPYDSDFYGPHPPPPGTFNPNPYSGGSLPPPGLPPLSTPYGHPSSGPHRPQYHPTTGPPHFIPQSHQPPHLRSHAQQQQHQHLPVVPPGQMRHLHHPQQNLGRGNAGHQGNDNVGHAGIYGPNQSNLPGSGSHSQNRPSGFQFSGSAPQAGDSSPNMQVAKGASHQGRRPEIEEDRRERKKRELERSKAEERQKRSSQQGGPGRSSSRAGMRDPRADKKLGADKIESRLKRPSTFLCKIRFRNELPDPVSQPKLMSINSDKDQYTKYSVSTLERNYKHKLYVEADLGIPLDLLDLCAYNAPHVRPPMDPADAELLVDDEITKRDSGTIRKKERPTDKGVAWLVKTQYISPLSLDPAKQAISEKQAKELKDRREGERLIKDLNDRDRQILAIDESFRVAKQLPVHQTKPHLEPVEVLPLLPDFDRWGDQFVHMIFDTDPTGESEALSKMDEDMRDEMEARAILKSYSFQTAEDAKPEKFVAYMIPKPEELDKDIDEDGEDITYSWVREYHWDLRTDATQSTYVFCFGEGGVAYLPLPTKLILQKRKAMEGRPSEDFENQFMVPSRVTVQRRDHTEEELLNRDASRRALLEGRNIQVTEMALQKRRRSPEPMTTLKGTEMLEEAVLNREDISEDDEEMSV